MKALVSTTEHEYDLEGEFIGWRICEVAEKEFDVHPSFFWIECNDYVLADKYYYDSENKTIAEVPQKDPLDGVIMDELEISPEDEADLLALLNEDEDFDGAPDDGTPDIEE